MSKALSDIGSLYISGNADTQAVGATALTVDDWDGGLSSTDNASIVADATTGYDITVKDAGVYKVSYVIDGEVNAAADGVTLDVRYSNDDWSTNTSVDGTEASWVSLTGQLDFNLSGQGLVEVQPNTAFRLYHVEYSAAATATFRDGTFVVERVA